MTDSTDDDMNETELRIRSVLRAHGIDATDELVEALLDIAYDFASMVADNERIAMGEQD